MRAHGGRSPLAAVCSPGTGKRGSSPLPIPARSLRAAGIFSTFLASEGAQRKGPLAGTSVSPVPRRGRGLLVFHSHPFPSGCRNFFHLFRKQGHTAEGAPCRNGCSLGTGERGSFPLPIPAPSLRAADIFLPVFSQTRATAEGLPAGTDAPPALGRGRTPRSPFPPTPFGLLAFSHLFYKRGYTVEGSLLEQMLPRRRVGEKLPASHSHPFPPSRLGTPFLLFIKKGIQRERGLSHPIEKMAASPSALPPLAQHFSPAFPTKRRREGHLLHPAPIHWRKR